jgi:hypothetical protein
MPDMVDRKNDALVIAQDVDKVLLEGREGGKAMAPDDDKARLAVWPPKLPGKTKARSKVNGKLLAVVFEVKASVRQFHHQSSDDRVNLH